MKPTRGLQAAIERLLRDGKPPRNVAKRLGVPLGVVQQIAEHVRPR